MRSRILSCGGAQAFEEAAVAAGSFVVADGHFEGFALTDEDDEFLAARDAGVNQITLKEEVLLRGEGDDDDGELGAL